MIYSEILTKSDSFTPREIYVQIIKKFNRCVVLGEQSKAVGWVN